jgi:ABC-type nitrate/sulfonate/bicarbonate transport system substrate-binding protein
VIVTRRTALATAAAALAAGPHAVSAQLTPVRLGLTRSDAQLAVECGVEMGMFHDAGLDVDVQTLGNSGLVASGVIAGALDVGICDDIQLSTAVLRGIPIAGFAGGALFTVDAPTLVLVSLKSGPVRVAKDLNGQTVAVVQLQSQSSVATTEWLRTHGADVSQIKLYEMPLAQMAPALNRGLISAAFLGEPYLSAAKDDLFVMGTPFEAIAKTFYVNSYFATRAWLAANRDTARRLAGALYAAGRWVNTHRPESAAIEARWMKIDPDRLSAMARNTFSTTFEARLYQPVLDIAARYHLLPNRISAAQVMATV